MINMYGWAIEKEGWIRFQNRLSLFRKYDQDEIDAMVYNAYKNMRKYGRGKTNKKLEERFEDIYKRKNKEKND